MADELKANEEISQGVSRIAKKQAADITKHLGHKRICSEADAVHHARKSIKKSRALLRLIRGRLGPKMYRRQNAVLGKLGHALSAVRDSTVQLKTLGSLCRGRPGQLSKKEFGSLRQALLRTRARRMRSLRASRLLHGAKLRRIKRGIANWKTKSLKAGDLWLGIEKARHRFMDAHLQARVAPNDENLHEWRKCTKDLLYQCCFLKNLNPKLFSGRIHELNKLGKYLGDVHDLALLESAVPKPPKGLLNSCKTRRIQLQRLAFALADKKLFADKFCVEGS